MQIAERCRLDKAHFAVGRIRMSKLQIQAGLAPVMFVDGALACPGAVEITLCTRAPTAQSRRSVNRKMAPVTNIPTTIAASIPGLRAIGDVDGSSH